MGEAEKTISLYEVTVQHGILLVSLVAGCWAVPRGMGTNLVESPRPVLFVVVSILSIVTLLIYSLGPMRDTNAWAVQRLARGLLGLAAGAVLFHVLAVLFGAPLIDKALDTHLWGWLVSALAVAPSACVFGRDSATWRRLYARGAPSGLKETALCIPAHGAVIGAWVGAWPIPLDWERPWQVWPITCTGGAVLGYTAAIWITQLIGWWWYTSLPKQKEL